MNVRGLDRGGRLTSAVLVVLVGCGGEGPTNPSGGSGGDSMGGVEVTVATSGSGSDADGYTVAVGGTSETIAADAAGTLDDIPPGSHNVQVSGVASHCRLLDAPDAVTVVAEQTVQVAIEVECVGDIAIDNFSTLHHLTSEGELIALTPTVNRIGLWKWAPDGNRIAFELDDGDQTDLWVVNADGTGLTNLTETADFSEHRPDWSPDASTIVYWRRPNDAGGGEVWSIGADGSAAESLATEGTNDWKPRWSPDGSLIAFTSDRNGTEAIFTMAPDGSDVGELTAELAFNPEWSPNGTHIAFESTRDGDQEVYVMASDGSDQVNLSNSAESEIGTEWFPDSQAFLFSGHRSGSYHIFVASIDGSDPVQLTTGDGVTNQNANVSPDGNHIIFARAVGASPGVYIMNPDGSDAWRVLNFGYDVRWRPGG